MLEDLYFLDEGQVKITAASVGISKLRWTSIDECEIDANKSKSLMEENRFDHLPIIDKYDLVTEFFKTKKPNNFNEIERLEIQFDDLIPLETNIRDVIEKFSEERTFYFLTFQRRVVGLITIGNLNCKQVQVFLFSIICELERALGDFLNSNLTQEQILSWISKKVTIENEDCKYKKILNQYNNLCSQDLENQLTEHFFLVDFFNIIQDFELYNLLKYSKSTWGNFSSVNELRKRIAHPTRSLIDNENSINKLKERIKKIEQLLFSLNTYKVKCSRC